MSNHGSEPNIVSVPEVTSDMSSFSASFKENTSPVSNGKSNLVQETQLSQNGLNWHQSNCYLVNGFAYDEVQKRLEVNFSRTGVYQFFEVPYHIFEGLRAANSKMCYIRRMIFDQYPQRKK